MSIQCRAWWNWRDERSGHGPRLLKYNIVPTSIANKIARKFFESGTRRILLPLLLYLCVLRGWAHGLASGSVVEPARFFSSDSLYSLSHESRRLRDPLMMWSCVAPPGKRHSAEASPQAGRGRSPKRAVRHSFSSRGCDRATVRGAVHLETERYRSRCGRDSGG